MAELMTHSARILYPRRQGGDRPQAVEPDQAAGSVLTAAGSDQILIVLDANLPSGEMAKAAAWVGSWPQAKLCLAVEPADRQLLLGVEAGGAEYISTSDLDSCDGFLIVADAFASNPCCCRGVLDRHKDEPQTPIVVIDSGGGAAAKFATHRVDVPAMGELEGLCALAAAAGLEASDVAGALSGGIPEIPSAAAAGKVLAACKKPAVIISAAYGRTTAWRQVGFIASKLAAALNGAIAPQTTGANALAAVRITERCGCLPLGEVLGGDQTRIVAVGCDVRGMLGRADLKILAAATALPNATTESAEMVLPVTMSGEYSGEYLLDGQQPAAVTPLLNPPVGVQSPADVVVALASAAGVAEPETPASEAWTQRLTEGPQAPAEQTEAPGEAVLLLGPQASQHGCGELTRHCTWQQSGPGAIPARISPRCAETMGVGNLSSVNVAVNGRSVSALVRISPELSDGIVVLPQALPETRAMAPSNADSDSCAVTAGPLSVQVSQ